MSTKKIAYVKSGSFSHINEQVLIGLKKVYVDYQIDVTEISDLIKSFGITEKLQLLREAIQLYGIKKVFCKGEARKYLLKTPSFFPLIRKKIKEKLQGKGYEFTLQIQSHFDANTGLYPHYIYTDHSHLTNLSYPGFSESQLLPKPWIAEEEKMYKSATAIFTMSSHVQNTLLEKYQCENSRVRCIYAGSNLVFSDEPYTLDRYASKTILFVGVDWERKGGPHLFESFKLALEGHPDAKLVVVGCSPKLDHPQCEVVGRIPLESVRNFYKSASIFCMPTRKEPFGIVFLEAMAYKLPIVSSTIGALPDFVTNGENGYLVNCGDVEGMANHLIELLDNPQKCLDMGLNSFKIVSERYTWLEVIKNMRNSIESSRSFSSVA